MHYWNQESEENNSLLVGSWGKSTAIRPPRDIDVLFILPDRVRTRLDGLTVGTNIQSVLLQEVRGVLAKNYRKTKMRGDGQVVVVPFVSHEIEVVPAFVHKSLFFREPTGKYIICNTGGGGSWTVTDPKAEQAHIREANTRTDGETRNLTRMLKRWQAHCHVEIKSFVLELLVVEFLDGWTHSKKGLAWYGYMVRDFLEFACQKNFFSGVTVPGTDEWLPCGSPLWNSKARSARARAAKACRYEASDKPGSGASAGSEWQKIFGPDIPLL
jgi:Second Messenger Oligonucleotide or Dinucleotide Synthetase domain